MPAISQAQREALERQVAQGAEAAELRGRTKICSHCGSGTNVLQERRNQIVQEIRDWFRTPGLAKDDHVAVRFCAALAEVVDLEIALGYRERVAASATEKLYGDQTAGA